MARAFDRVPRHHGSAVVLGLAWALAVRAGLSWSGELAVQPSVGPERAGRRFSIEQVGDTSWLVRPGGERFFSFGVCCVNQGVRREEFDPANPGYAAWQHYADPDMWAAATLRRLRTWSVSTIGGWSDFQTLGRSADTNLAFAPVLHIGAGAGAPWCDMWDPGTLERMDRVAHAGILPLRGDPRVMGYYTDNEIGWWSAILFKTTLEQASTSGQRRRLMRVLRERYGNDWSALLRDFDPAPDVESWEDLERHGVIYLHPGGDGIRLEREFMATLAERYYSLVRDLVLKYDPQALVLGDRYPGFYFPEAARAGAAYLDAVSCNLNATWNDGTFPRFYLDTLHALTGKPVIVGEFYLCARENRSGNRNSHGTYPVVATQKERAAACRNTLVRLAETPWVVGADWFQYCDQPTHGRFDGENFNFGLVDIHDRPYAALGSTLAGLRLTTLKQLPVRPRADAAQGVPPAPAKPWDHFEPTRALLEWDRERAFVKPASELPLADLYVCWNPKAVLLGLCAQDVVEDVAYRGQTVPASERAEWRVSIAGRTQPIRARIGAGMEPVVDEPSVPVLNISGIGGNVRNLAGMELPARLFGQRAFKPGDGVEFAATYLSHGHAWRVEWRGRFVLRSR